MSQRSNQACQPGEKEFLEAVLSLPKSQIESFFEARRQVYYAQMRTADSELTPPEARTGITLTMIQYKVTMLDELENYVLQFVE